LGNAEAGDLGEQDERSLAVALHGTPKLAADIRAAIVTRWTEAGRECQESLEKERQRLQSEADRLRREGRQ
jgi:hypothetical protein